MVLATRGQIQRRHCSCCFGFCGFHLNLKFTRPFQLATKIFMDFNCKVLYSLFSSPFVQHSYILPSIYFIAANLFIGIWSKYRAELKFISYLFFFYRVDKLKVTQLPVCSAFCVYGLFPHGAVYCFTPMPGWFFWFWFCALSVFDSIFTFIRSSLFSC
jgi:hypothetical protein